MTRTSPTLALLALTALASACGPLDPSEELTSAGAPPEGLLARSSDGGGGGSAVTAIRLSSASVTGGGLVTGTVTAGGGTLVYLSFSKTLLAGPGWVRIPSGQSSASFTLYASPFLTSAAATTVSARTSNPFPAAFVSQTLTVTPATTFPAVRPQVASATLSSSAVKTGTAVTCTLTLSAPAPDVGAAVQVAISNDFLGLDADVPPVVMVAPGATTASFTVRTHLSSGVTTSVTEYVVANLFGGTFQGGALLVSR